MATAISLCHGFVDAFLLVIRFGTRFTTEEKSALEALKRIFGDGYLNHLVVVITCGDLFQGTMEEENREITFHEWCREQRGELGELYDDCQGRFVLFNNREKSEEKKRAHIQEIVQLAQGLRNNHGRYTSKCFQDAERERQKMILELRAPELTLEIQKKISLLTAEIEVFSKLPAGSNSDSIRARIQDLKREIEVQDNGLGVLNHLMILVEKVEENLHNAEQLQNLTQELENLRRAHTFSNTFTSLLTSVGSALALVLPPVGLSLALGGAAGNSANRMIYNSRTRNIEERQDEIKKQMKNNIAYDNHASKKK